jgi:hypothetical protein
MGESEPKSDLRRVIRQSRAARASSHSEETARGFTEHLTAVAVDSSWTRIASFLPTSTEPPITDFLSEFISQGGWCAVPESGQDGVLLWHALGDDFERSSRHRFSRNADSVDTKPHCARQSRRSSRSRSGGGPRRQPTRLGQGLLRPISWFARQLNSGCCRCF